MTPRASLRPLRKTATYRRAVNELFLTLGVRGFLGELLLVIVPLLAVIDADGEGEPLSRPLPVVRSQLERDGFFGIRRVRSIAALSENRTCRATISVR